MKIILLLSTVLCQNGVLMNINVGGNNPLGVNPRVRLNVRYEGQNANEIRDNSQVLVNVAGNA